MATTAPPQAAPPRRGSGLAAPIVAALVIVGLIVVIAGLFVATTVGGRQSRHLSETYTGVRTIDVQVSAEAVELVASADDVTRLDRTATWSVREPRLTQQLDGDRLVVRSSCPFGFGLGCSGRVRIDVPSGVDVRVHSSAGAVRAEGLSGALDLSTSAGSVRATNLTSSDVRASSSAGSVTVELASEPMRVTASSSAGSVTVLLPRGDATYRVSAKTSAGSENVDVRTDPASDRVVDVHSSAGSVRVGYLP
ncbi:MAG TPA: DUF4097 family beta strand repeat-containing protein [Angustibacter sp.]|nr:DUF4097 family beta strand repeat-containing protein [Angustibacter sp.]